MEGITDRIQGPVLGQAGLIAEALDNCATHVKFTVEEAAGAHCKVGARGIIESEDDELF